ncbi:MAG: dTDP-4-dehydrorhamnose 3,5-epimerase family protein [Bacteroidales bacterium]|jgi:dTDP-4-dehydrorhamnose 3,5-epimerase|nr:dTDP-4-dehydrorhamnose 3,5-epimerase family protein [Bacteroidales bacterium]
MSYKDFQIQKSKILPEVLTIQPSMHWDLRGSIYSSFNADFYPEFLPKKLDFKHDKFAESNYNVLRGLHGDNKTWKLVSCVWGELYEVVVDMRKESPTYKKWDAFELKSNVYKQVLIPPGFINGYYVKSEHAVFHYKLAYDGDYIDAGEQMTFRWDDKELRIDWPCKDPILQARDK